MFNQLRDLDFRDVGSAPTSVRYVLLSFLLVIIFAIGYFLLIKNKIEQLEIVQKKEVALRVQFENKQGKSANLEAYEVQLAEMQEVLKTMFRQLPSKTEMDKLLVDVSQTALAAGIDVQLFQPGGETHHDFYAERPISVHMLGDFHQFGDFVYGVASLPRYVILTMHDISLRRANRDDIRGGKGHLILQGTVKTYRYIDENEAAALAQANAP